jgi:hypothetical protein
MNNINNYQSDPIMTPPITTIETEAVPTYIYVKPDPNAIPTAPSVLLPNPLPPRKITIINSADSPIERLYLLRAEMGDFLLKNSDFNS